MTGLVSCPTKLSAGAFSGAFDTAEKLSTVESLRKGNFISTAQLALASGISANWYRTVVAEPHRASPQLVAKLIAGLQVLQAQAKTAPTKPWILSTYGGFLVAMAPFYGVTPSAVRAADPQRGATASTHWQACAHARQAAIYLTHTALGLPQRALAAALGVTPAAVCLGLKSVEDRRDDPAFHAALEAAHRDVMGGLQ